MGNTYLQSMNVLQESLAHKLSDFERLFCDNVDLERHHVCIETDTYPALNGDSILIHVRVDNMDLWTKYWHARFCNEFNVHLWDYRIKYSFAEQYFGCGRYFEYIYAPNDENFIMEVIYHEDKVYEKMHCHECGYHEIKERPVYRYDPKKYERKRLDYE